MHRNPWFTLILGLMVGLVFGYVLAERQPVPPGKALMLATPKAGTQGEAFPEGHPPVADTGGEDAQRLARQIAEVERLLATNPEEVGLMVALGNLYFDAQQWEESRVWYEKSLEIAPGDPGVITDLSVAYRSLNKPERAVEFLDQAIGLKADHWEAWYNKVVILQFDLHDHDQAATALRTLQQLRTENPSIPDLSKLEREVFGN